ncbi:MAG TPA: SDR family oxidoreductase [Burkholderiaceae bacterium]|nr:SDR family oxidoreductase [Burkholderiaceae bacterium]
MKVLVTGANGFVGQALLPALLRAGHSVRAAVRVPGRCGSPIDEVAVGDLSEATDWRAAVDGTDCVIHLAARVHVMRDVAADPLQAFRRVNVAATEALARAAAEAGVRRLVYLSSVKVNGESTTGRAAFTESDPPLPQDPYGVSKAEAESALRAAGRATGLQIVVLRPPLVYGPQVKGNFLRLLRWVSRGVPLPLASADNRRSLIYVGNLADALVACVEHPDAANELFLVSDREDLSTAQLIRRLADALGVRPRLLRFPPSLLSALAGAAGKSAEAERLLGSLRIDSTRISQRLGWSPPHPVDQGLRATAAWYRDWAAAGGGRPADARGA